MAIHFWAERERERHALLTKAIELVLAALENAPNIGLINTCNNLCFSNENADNSSAFNGITKLNKGLKGTG